MNQKNLPRCTEPYASPVTNSTIRNRFELPGNDVIFASSTKCETPPERKPYPADLNADAAWIACINQSWHERDFEHAEKIGKILLLKAPANAKFMTALLHIRAHIGEIDIWPDPRLSTFLAPREGRPLLYKRWFSDLRKLRDGEIDGAIRLFRIIADAVKKEAPFAFGLNLREHDQTLALLQQEKLLSKIFWNPVQPISDDNRPFTILGAGNQDYMDRYSGDLLRSVNEKCPGAFIHFHYCDPNVDPERQLGEARAAFPSLRISASWSVQRELPRPTYFACARYLIAPQLLRQTQAPLLILDLDATLRCNPTDFLGVLSDVDLGLSITDNSNHWNTIKAGMLWAAPTHNGVRFMTGLANYLNAVLTSSQCMWTLDQTALWTTHRHIPKICPDARVINLHKASLPDGRTLNLVEEITNQLSVSKSRAIARARARTASS